jgi:phosphate starvation-inducible PhoH-like protein
MKYPIPRNKVQENFLLALAKLDMVFATGPAGTGKTFIAAAHAAQELFEKRCTRIVVTRPLVQAGEDIGILPGDIGEKTHPYMLPVYDALREVMGDAKLANYLELGKIEIAPLGFMRGRTLRNCIVLLDEAQNCTYTQLLMALTRLGEGGQMIITGDLSQVDLPSHTPSGLQTVIIKLRGVQGIGFLEFDTSHIVRHPLVSAIVKALSQ